MKTQVHASIDQTLFNVIEREAVDEQRTISNLIALLISKGWEQYQQER